MRWIICCVQRWHCFLRLIARRSGDINLLLPVTSPLWPQTVHASHTQSWHRENTNIYKTKPVYSLIFSFPNWLAYSAWWWTSVLSNSCAACMYSNPTHGFQSGVSYVMPCFANSACLFNSKNEGIVVPTTITVAVSSGVYAVSQPFRVSSASLCLAVCSTFFLQMNRWTTLPAVQIKLDHKVQRLSSV